MNRAEKYKHALDAIEILSHINMGDVTDEDGIEVLLGWQKAMYFYEELLNANAPADVNAWRGSL